MPHTSGTQSVWHGKSRTQWDCFIPESFTSSLVFCSASGRIQYESIATVLTSPTGGMLLLCRGSFPCFSVVLSRGRTPFTYLVPIHITCDQWLYSFGGGRRHLLASIVGLLTRSPRAFSAALVWESSSLGWKRP